MKGNLIKHFLKIQKDRVEIDIIVTIIKIVEIVIVIQVRIFKFKYRPITQLSNAHSTLTKTKGVQ